MDGIARTWDLMRRSFLVLCGDPQLVVFPILSGLALLAVDVPAAVIYGPQLKGGHIPADLEPFVFLLYWLNAFVALFFNSALMACAYARIAGGDGALRAGFRTAWSNVERLFLWSFIAATVSVVLQAFEQNRTVRRLIASTLEMAWSLATFFVLPVLIFEDTDVFGAFPRSAQLFRQHWGDQVSSNVSFGVLYLLLMLPACLAPFLFPAVGVVAGALGALAYVIVLYVVLTAVQAIFVVELYRFATRGHADGGFGPDELQNAFS